MTIEDDELRKLYRISSEERLQKLETGLLHLEEHPEDETVLETLGHELHSLKGDSRSVGQETIANLTQQIEDIVKRLQHREIQLTLELSNCLYQGVDAIAQLVYEAVTGEPTRIDLTQISEQLIVAVSAVEEPPLKFNQPLPSTLPLAPTFLDDEELREIYQTTSLERLQKLKTSLVQLESHPTDETALDILRREVHSLKGDSRAVGLETIASLAQQLETILRSTQQGEIYFTLVLNIAFDQGLDTIAQLVHEAVTGEPSEVDVTQVLNHLAQVIWNRSDPHKTLELVPNSEHHSASGSVIEDSELREIYRITSEERLQRLETGLLQLEQHSHDEGVLAELLRETHSLKGDSRSAGVNTVESLVHSLEDILGAIQRREIEVTPGLSDRLYQGLDAIGQLIQEAITGEPSSVNLAQILDDLAQTIPTPIEFSESLMDTSLLEVLAPEVLAPEGLVPEVLTPRATVSEISGQEWPVSTVSDPYQIDTIRVPTRDLDALMNQVEELTTTRIQIAQAMTQMREFAALWDEWKASKNQGHPSTDSTPYVEELTTLVSRLRSTALEGGTKLDFITEALRERILTLRLLPLSRLFQSFPRMVRDLSRQQSKEVQIIIEGGEATADKRILEEMKDALTHLIRNAIDHGIESPEERVSLGKPRTATIWLKGYQTSSSIVIEVVDDGRGLSLEQIKQTAIKRRLCNPEDLDTMTSAQLYDLIFTPGFSTRTFITELSGRGVGLDVVRTSVDRLKGTIQVISTPNQGCTFRLQLSTSLTTANVVLVEVHGILYALPIEFLQTSLLVSLDDMMTVDGHNTIIFGDQTIRVSSLVDVLELSNSPAYATVAKISPHLNNRQPCLILQMGEEVGGFLVDRLLTTQEVALKPQSPLLKRVRNVMGATILGSGEVCMILNPSDLLKSLQQSTPATPIRPETLPQRKRVILLVEDSPPVRIQEKRLFESAGYEVVIATDGLDGYNQLRTREVDAIVSDIEMPNLDGLSLTAKIRQHSEYDKLPIILVTTLAADEDRKRGAEAGADAYIIKGKFNQDVLLETLERLV
jgi:two-component system, chemotaxis family, sensor kinase CheA